MSTQKTKKKTTKRLNNSGNTSSAALGWSERPAVHWAPCRGFCSWPPSENSKTRCWNENEISKMKIRGGCQKFWKDTTVLSEATTKWCEWYKVSFERSLLIIFFGVLVYWRGVRARWSIMSTLLSQSRLQTMWVRQTSIRIDDWMIEVKWYEMYWRLKW